MSEERIAEICKTCLKGAKPGDTHITVSVRECVEAGYNAGYADALEAAARVCETTATELDPNQELAMAIRALVPKAKP